MAYLSNESYMSYSDPVDLRFTIYDLQSPYRLRNPPRGPLFFIRVCSLVKDFMFRRMS